MKKSFVIAVLFLIIGCSKASTFHKMRVVTFCMDKDFNYTTPKNVLMYLNANTCVCLTDSLYGYNNNPTFQLDNVEDGSKLRIVSFTNAGEETQYKTIVVYFNDKMVYNAYNQVFIDTLIDLNYK